MQKWILSAVLIVYFVFTSGMVFEVTKSEAIGNIDIPYNFALSAERTGVVGVYSEADVECAKWLAINTDGISDIYADINGFLLLTGYIDPYTQLQEPIVDKIEMGNDEYLFLTEWNVRHGEMVLHTGQSGMRTYAPLPDVKGRKVLYESGQAVIYK